MEYNGFNQLTKEYQEHTGAVNTSTTPKVQYGYEPGNASTTQTNNIRPTTLTYPNGRVITYQYGTSNGLNDSLNRANEIYDTTNSQSLAQYVYGYDSLNRLISMDRGTGGTLNFTEAWNLDETGNWLSYDTTDGTSSTLSQTRTVRARPALARKAI